MFSSNSSSLFRKTFARQNFVQNTLSHLGLLIFSYAIASNSAHAFSITLQNDTFDDPSTGLGTLAGWTTHGDVSTTGNLGYGSAGATINPLSGTNQAIITTGHLDGTFSDTARDDDGVFNFNQSGTNPLDADTEVDTADLQSSLGFGVNAFSIPRVGGIGLPDERVAKEGSAITQEFSVTLDGTEDNFQVSFNWAYATNDDTDPLYGESDYGFWSLGRLDELGNYTTVFDNTDSPDSPTNEIIVLDSSRGSAVSAIADNIYGQGFDYNSVTYSVDTSGLTAGTYNYQIGFGVIDVDGFENTSALLLDNIEVVPFEFSPLPGIGLILGLFWFKKKKSIAKNQ